MTSSYSNLQLLRVSIQAYNTPDDANRLIKAFSAALEPTAGERSS